MVNSIIRTRKSENTANIYIYMKKMDISQNKLKNINKYTKYTIFRIFSFIKLVSFSEIKYIFECTN
mgnify:CR=1 FL=1